MSENSLNSVKSAGLQLQQNNDEVLICCFERIQDVFKVKKNSVKLLCDKFSNSNFEAIFILDVPYVHLKLIVDFINGEEIELLKGDVSSIVKTCEKLQIVDLLAMIKESEKEEGELISEDSSPTQKVISEQIVGPENNVFDRLWFKDSELNEESDEFDLNDTQAQNSSSTESSTYFDCCETIKNQNSEISEHSIQVGSSSDSSISILSGDSLVVNDLPKLKAVNNTSRPFPTFIQLSPFGSGDCGSLPSLILQPPPLKPCFNVIRSTKDEIKTAKEETSKKKNDGKRFKCAICDRVLSWRQSLRVHILKKHPGNNPSEHIRIISD